MKQLNELINGLEKLKWPTIETGNKDGFNAGINAAANYLEEYFGANEELGSLLPKRTRDACLYYLFSINELEFPKTLPDGWTRRQMLDELGINLTRSELAIVRDKISAGGSIRYLGKRGIEKLNSILDETKP